MATIKTVERSIRLAGPCQEWFPIIKESLHAHGCQNITADERLLCLCADYRENLACGHISVTITQSAICNETNVNTVATVNLGGASLC